MRQMRRAAFALVIAAFLIAPAAILAHDQPTVGGAQTVPESPGSSPAVSGGISAVPPTAATPVVGATQVVEEAPSATTSAKARGAVAGASAAAAVSMVDFGFNPTDVTITEGDQITWTNNGKVAHTATGESFNSGRMEPGASYTHTFNQVAVIDYVCNFHQQMTGTITVLAANSGGNGTPNNNNNNTSNNNGNGNNSGGTGVGTGGSSGTDAVTPAPTDSSSLPTTGLNAVLLAEIAIGLVAMGLLIRQLVRN